MTNLILDRWFLVTLTLLISFSLCFIRRLIGSTEDWWNIHWRQKMSATSPLYGTKVMKCICLVHLFFHSAGRNCPINDNDLELRKKFQCFGMKKKLATFWDEDILNLCLWTRNIKYLEQHSYFFILIIFVIEHLLLICGRKKKLTSS